MSILRKCKAYNMSYQCQPSEPKTINYTIKLGKISNIHIPQASDIHRLIKIITAEFSITPKCIEHHEYSITYHNTILPITRNPN